jgi:hypothetical protein
MTPGSTTCGMLPVTPHPRTCAPPHPRTHTRQYPRDAPPPPDRPPPKLELPDLPEDDEL